MVEQAKPMFGSFAVPKANCDSRVYNDGFEYYEDLYHRIMSAERMICMTGWMITPYFMLKRPAGIDKREWRLDGVLEAAAKRGVRIFVIAYRESEMILSNDSFHVEKMFMKMHPNIKVMRHPSVLIPASWTHHEKMVIIDQKYAFMGGLDIAYGRWDTPDHYLRDPGRADPRGPLWDGAEFNNARIKDVTEPRNYTHSNLNLDFEPKMPWHDIAIQLVGDSAVELLRHFVQYWFFVKEELAMSPKKFFGVVKNRYKDALQHKRLKMKEVRMSELSNEIGADEETEMSFAERFDEMKTKGRILILGDEVNPKEICITALPGVRAGNETHQLLRSGSPWSIGLPEGKHECSIHNAYIHLIETAEDYIYIENQFFISVENKIVETLANRVAKAINSKRPFKLIVCMPLFPGFAGDITAEKREVLHIQVHYQYQSISRGQDALFTRLTRMTGLSNFDEWVFFFGLRQIDIINDTPVTEIIYIHSKLIIVDDKRMLVGSANINDRSLLGTRDSEIAVTVFEQEGGQKSFNLRARLFEEHFGLTEQESRSFPRSPDIWQKMIRNARRNTEIYRKLFYCLPDNTIKTAEQARKVEETRTVNLEEYPSLRSQIFGHAVEFPLDFFAG